MGVWSQCIYVYPNESMVDLSKIDKKVLQNLSHSGFFNKYLDENQSSIMSLDEIKSECYDTAKIYGYLDETELSSWDSLLCALAEQIPGSDIEFHFYCSDDRFPYFFQYCHENKTTYYYTGQSNHIAYYDIVYTNDDQNKPQSISIRFNNDKYINNYRLIHYSEYNRQTLRHKIAYQNLTYRNILNNLFSR